ncbi:hypothetical protein AA0111_g2609 [Alternaria arborescens]|uniref:hypothetical protein n=1 Tax=Alternaria arborescens TaxID=156630 RepID=UPI0010752C10|nr:hypothetical protein AA0111_g2609 [Alternaria arborescens]RYO37955.1 hypothetical protein AA0111_g2609 [Alternaria arborescens]
MCWFTLTPAKGGKQNRPSTDSSCAEELVRVHRSPASPRFSDVRVKVPNITLEVDEKDIRICTHCTCIQFTAIITTTTLVCPTLQKFAFEAQADNALFQPLVLRHQPASHLAARQLLALVLVNPPTIPKSLSRQQVQQQSEKAPAPLSAASNKSEREVPYAELPVTKSWVNKPRGIGIA